MKRLFLLVAVCAADDTVDVAVDAGGGQAQADGGSSFADGAMPDLAKLAPVVQFTNETQG